MTIIYPRPMNNPLESVVLAEVDGVKIGEAIPKASLTSTTSTTNSTSSTIHEATRVCIFRIRVTMAQIQPLHTFHPHSPRTRPRRLKLLGPPHHSLVVDQTTSSLHTKRQLEAIIRHIRQDQIKCTPMALLSLLTRQLRLLPQTTCQTTTATMGVRMPMAVVSIITPMTSKTSIPRTAVRAITAMEGALVRAIVSRLGTMGPSQIHSVRIVAAGEEAL